VRCNVLTTLSKTRDSNGEKRDKPSAEPMFRATKHYEPRYAEEPLRSVVNTIALILAGRYGSAAHPGTFPVTRQTGWCALTEYSVAFSYFLTLRETEANLSKPGGS
jgi:hypothetical protein